MTRLCALVLVLFASVQVSAAVTMLFQGDFETGTMKNTANKAVDYFWVGGSTLPSGPLVPANIGTNCIGQNNGPSNKIITSPVLSGTKANSQTLYWTCDYRPLNGDATNWKQKPRNAISHGEEIDPVYHMKLGATYWYTLSIYLPTDYVTDTYGTRKVNLFQLHKSKAAPRGDDPAQVWVVEEDGNFKIGVTAVDGNNSVEAASPYGVRHTWTATKGEWHTILINSKPCFSGADSCGFTKIYISNTERRAALTEKTAVWTDVGPNMERADQQYRMSPNVYKYDWHCLNDKQTAVTQTQMNACMAEPPPSNTSTYSSTTGDASPITVYYDQINIATALDSDDINAAIPVVAPSFSDAIVNPDTPSIIRMNGGRALEVDGDSNYTTNTTTNGSWGVYEADVTDGVNTDNFTAISSNATGGCAVLGPMATVNGGNVTVNFRYDLPDVDSDRNGSNDTPLIDWSLFNLTTPVLYESGDACFDFPNAVTITNSIASGSLLNSPTTDNISVVATDEVTGRFILKGGSTSSIRARITCNAALEHVEVYGTLGSLPSIPQTKETGSGWVVRETVVRGISIVEIEFTASETGDCTIKAGMSSTTQGATLRFLKAQLWKNRTPTTMSFNTQVDKPDIILPVLSGCTSDWDATAKTAVLGCDVSEIVTLKVAITDSVTPPTKADVIAGTVSGAIWQGYAVGGAIENGSVGTISPVLDPYIDKYVYFAAIDLSGNQSESVVAAAYIPAEVETQTKKFVWSEAAGNAISCYNANTNTLTPFTGNMAITITTGDWFAVGDDVVELAYDSSVAFLNGQSTVGMIEENLESGSVNALLGGEQGYNFWATDGTCRVDNGIQLTVE